MNTDTIDVHAIDTTTGLPAQPVARPLAPAPASNPYMAMVHTAMDSGRGIEQLDRLLDLQLKWDAEQARRAWVAAMAAFKADPIVIEKRKLVEFTTRDGDTTSYRHATLADVVDAVVAGMGRHGLSHRWDVKQETGQVAVTCTVTHRDGHSESVEMFAAPDNSGKKNAIQQVASTVAYLQRYTLMSATGVAAKDMDDDGIMGGAPQVEFITDEQVAILRDLIDAYVVNEGKFMDWLRGACRNQQIQALEEVPADCYNRIHDQLGRIRKQKVAEGKAPAAEGSTNG